MLAVAVLGPTLASAGSRAAAGASHEHLYVLDVGSLAVYRFALAADGLPAAKPDGAFEPIGAKDPQGLAVDSAGHVFLADEEAGSVTEFATGANGPQNAISTLNLPNSGPFHLKIDGADRLYVEYGENQNQSIGIYAKGARGNDSPISVIAPYYSPELAADYAIAPSGALYILNWSMGASIIGYNKPLDSPTKPDVFASLEGGLEFDPAYSMAFDDATNQLYFQFSPQDIGHERYMDFAVRMPPYLSYNAKHDPMLFSGQCPAQDGQSGGAVIAKQYLIVSCVFNPEVLVYRKDLFGERRPVEIIGRGIFGGPSQIAVGP